MGPIARWALCVLPMLAAFTASARADAACQLGKYLELPVTMRGTRPIVSAQIGGKDVQFLLDSGAFYSTLSRAAAIQYGLRLEAAPPWFRLKGIKGEAEAALTTVKNFGLGTITLPSVQFIVGGTDTGQIGLLGQNFLHIGDAEYDLPHGAVRLLKSTGCGTAGLAYWAGARPVTMVELDSSSDSQTFRTLGTIMLNGVKLRAIFDTGSPSSILTLAAAKKAGVTPDSPGVKSSGLASGVGRGSTQTWIGTFATIDIGGETIKSPRIAFADIELNEADLLIGADFFLTHRIYVANKQNRMYVTYEGGPLFGLTPRGAVTATGQRIDLTDTGTEPTDAEGFARRGAIAAANGRVENAIADLDKAIALDPKQARYLRQRATLRMDNGRPLLALADLDKALELDPADAEARFIRAGMKLRARDPGGAAEDLRVLDAKLPAGAGQRLALAAMADIAGYPELALDNYSGWLKTHPDDAMRANALNGRCWARAQLNRELEAALGDCNAALRLRPNLGAYLDSRALVRFRQGDLAAALVDYDAVLKTDPRNGWSLYARGLVKAKLGDQAGAKVDRDAAIAIDPHLPDRARRMGLEG